MDREETEMQGEGVPRWVKVFAAIGLAVMVLIVVALLSGHGPGWHLSYGAAAPAVAWGGHG
ncbi:hypothetical protein [Actinoplanes utahensis]|uniref:hypothetical protein n=1 Tax=Actinoplanes utahensis TaxID=1869 RepID=UPI00194E0511|nr:hypothetical protein [Actinoplanes utahensis]GIF34091.1 hypothetical protein Aut01nite_70770 [Actinoplanes utahensis]